MAEQRNTLKKASTKTVFPLREGANRTACHAVDFNNVVTQLSTDVKVQDITNAAGGLPTHTFPAVPEEYDTDYMQGILATITDKINKINDALYKAGITSEEI
tara:strand:+ start:798 stop:1103 length:306 start_codon:yes stop_codon:yes gene_type:complete